MSTGPSPVTVAVSRRVRPGREAEFEHWADGIAAVAAEFPGYLGNGHLRPAEECAEHTLVYRFDNEEHLGAWLRSTERSDWVQRSRDLIEGEPHTEMATGLEYWFRDPSMPDAGPAVWKQALLTWVGLYPTALAVAYTAGLLVAAWILPLRSLVTTALTVVLMTWVVMPLVTRLFRGWLRSTPTT